MIQNERELRAAMEWLEYWNSTRTGAQSWIGNEQAAQKVAELREEIAAYRRRAAATTPPVPAPSTGGEDVPSDHSASSTV